MVGFWGRIKAEFVQDVPAEIAFCEFNCHKQQCTEGEWQTCPRRIARAAGELIPTRKISAAAIVVRSH